MGPMSFRGYLKVVYVTFQSIIKNLKIL